ncbi:MULTISPECIES: DUF397 domain-containing protein [Streptomyces]|uniref:DUF397 domain-containing protein n=1 Tax=Streptomyces lycii TaxID=2654337 RepID=A0ABQ7FLT4_9ACTN|nr:MULTISPECIES: DUF397 domain-containing protein [Streptomyces]KAF4409785.1 DUF397 domain-containing protein [Streptomyces lycii]PGH50000.1 DUF397 domain-containing protein [Streptomyces sp. Ru87]
MYWQQSSHCPEGNSCVNVASAADGTLRLRESESPGAVLAPTRAALRALIRDVKADAYGGARGPR